MVFLDVPVVSQTGATTLTITLSTAEYGSCTAGQLSAGTEVGLVGPGSSTVGESLSAWAFGTRAPSLNMALFGATRPTGNPTVTVTPWSGRIWQIAQPFTGGTYLGTAQSLYGDDDTSSIPGSFTWQVGNTQTPSISGIVAEFFLPGIPSNCFGGGSCLGPGTSCVMSNVYETAGDFMLIAINYKADGNLIGGVSDGGVDQFTFVGGEFANSQSVAFYDVTSEHGGGVTLYVTLTAAEYGSCTAVGLSPGTAVGVVGQGDSTSAGESLSVTNTAIHEPSLLMALFGATRPTGSPSVTVSSGSTWPVAQPYTGTASLGTAQSLYGDDDTGSGTVTFTWHVGNTQTPSISGIAVEFFTGSQLKVMVNINFLTFYGIPYGESDNINVYFGGSFAANFITEWGYLGWADDIAALLAGLVAGDVIGGALGGFLIAAGYTYMSNELTTLEGQTYWPNGGANSGYLEFDTDSFDYYPAVVNYADSIEINAFNGQSWTSFLPSVPWIAYAGFSGTALADLYSVECVSWIQSNGSGWVIEAT